MTLIQAIILAALQGLTEFLPISSSGHLAVGQRMLGMEPSLYFITATHMGTLISILVVFRREVRELMVGLARSARALVRCKLLSAFRNDPQVRLFALVILATLPTGIVAIFIKTFVLERIESAVFLFVGLAWLINGGVLFANRCSRRQAQSDHNPGILDGLLIGLAQGLAVIYGLSRSGLTISTGLFRQLGAGYAVKFSFLIAIPAILGAQVLELAASSRVARPDLRCILAAVLVSAVVGYVFLKLLIGIVRRGKLALFAYYCWLVGALAVCYHFITQT